VILRPPRVGTGAWFPGRYYTKGSGGNGVNTVYFVDTTGHACPSGTGLPVAGAPADLAYRLQPAAAPGRTRAGPALLVCVP